LAVLDYQEVVLTDIITGTAERLGNIVTLLLVQLKDLEISWDKCVFYTCCLQPNALTKHTNKSFRLHQSI